MLMPLIYKFLAHFFSLEQSLPPSAGWFVFFSVSLLIRAQNKAAVSSSFSPTLRIIWYAGDRKLHMRHKKPCESNDAI